MLPIRVAAISNSKSFQAGVRQPFVGDPGFDFVGACPREEVRRLIKSRRPDVLLVDGRIERPLDLYSGVGRENRPWIIVLANEAEDLAEFRDLWQIAALEAGARGVLGRGSISMARELADAVRAVHDGQLWGPRAVVDRALECLARSFQGTDDGEAGGLPRRSARN